MTSVIAAELLKLRTTRAFYGIVLGALGLIALIVGAAALAADFDGVGRPAEDLVTVASLAQAFALVLGVLAVTTEFRHGTITPTLLVTPDRMRLVLAKLAAHLLAGLALAVAAYGLSAGLAIVLLDARGIDAGLEGGELTEVLAGGMLATALFAGLGVGVGALVRNQVGAIVVSLSWLFLIEPLLTAIPGIDEAVQKYAPGGAANGLSATTDEAADMLGRVPAGLVFLAYVTAFVAAGIVLMRRRDVS